jgi:membrane-associated phospholipid phosphatase
MLPRLPTVAALRTELREQWPGDRRWRSASGERWALAIGLVAATLALVLWAAAGPFGAFLTLNRAATVVPDALWGPITTFGDALVLGVLPLFLARRHPHLLWIVFLGVLIGGLLTHLPKGLVALPRPGGLLDPADFHLIGPLLRSKGPPSGHALAVFLLATVAIHWIPRTGWRVAVLGLAIVVAFSRIAVGAHWPFDVLTGAALGALGGWLSIRIAYHLPLGRNVWAHLALLAFFLASAVSLVGFDPRYPFGREVCVVVGLAAIYEALRQYLWPARPVGG